MATALVVGAGIGGLAATLALRGAGWDVRVLERAGSPRELGFALLLAPNAMRALRALGLADRVAASGHIASVTEMRRPNGKVLRRMDASEVYKLLGEPAVVALRPVLHGTLLSAVGHDSILLNHEVVGFSTGGDGVNVRLADGHSLSARVLIGADGVASVVRRQVRSGEPPPRDSGLFALRGVAHGVVDRLNGASGAQYFGRGIEAGVAQASSDAVYWYMSIPADQVRQGSLKPDDVADRFTTAFHEPFRAIVHATASWDMRLDELFDREPLDRWGEGPVTLLGDAAHPMLPHAGQGAAQALEDAVALGRALARGTVPEAAFRDYERIRAPRTAKIVKLARRNASLGSLRNPVAVWARDMALRHVPERVMLERLVAEGRPPEEL